MLTPSTCWCPEEAAELCTITRAGVFLFSRPRALWLGVFPFEMQTQAVLTCSGFPQEMSQ